MGELDKLQRHFAAAVLTAREALPAELATRPGGEPHRRRFSVYRNNVYSSLIEVMQARFPVVARLVGEEFFRAMARVYVEQEPPRSAVLLRYGMSFPAFIEGFEPAASVVYLADIAALEWAWHAAYHAADALPLTLEELASVADHAGGAVLKLHPSLGLVSSAYPIVTIYELHAEGNEPPQTRLEAQGEDALVLRPHLEVEIRRLPTGAVTFIETIRDGGSIGEAAEAALGYARDFDLEANLAGLMTSGAIVGVCGVPPTALTKS
jgi:putative DNA-binding protein